MSSHTRMMLDKLKQSTSELQGLTDGAEEPVFSPRKPGAERRKKSRFLRPEAEEEVQEEDLPGPHTRCGLGAHNPGTVWSP